MCRKTPRRLLCCPTPVCPLPRCTLLGTWTRISCHYLDSVGYQELPAFWTPENYLKNAEMQLEDDYGMIDGIINNGPKEQPRMQEAERGTDDLQKRPSVLARLRAPQPCQEKNVRKHAERDLE